MRDMKPGVTLIEPPHVIEVDDFEGTTYHKLVWDVGGHTYCTQDFTIAVPKYIFEEIQRGEVSWARLVSVAPEA